MKAEGEGDQPDESYDHEYEACYVNDFRVIGVEWGSILREAFSIGIVVDQTEDFERELDVQSDNRSEVEHVDASTRYQELFEKLEEVHSFFESLLDEHQQGETDEIYGEQEVRQSLLLILVGQQDGGAAKG